MARTPASEEVKKAHPGAVEVEHLKDEENGFFEYFIYNDKGEEIARLWGTFQRD